MTDRVVHFEIPFDDAERARTFYRDAFGWQLMTMPDGDYTMAMTGPGERGPSEPGFINGGLFGRTDEFKTPNVVIEVGNLEDALKRATDAGASIVRERQPVGDMGFTAYFLDTEGNVVGLWETVAS